MLRKVLWDACKTLWFELVRGRTRFCVQKLKRSFSLCAPEIIYLFGFVENIGRDVQKNVLIEGMVFCIFLSWLVIVKLVLIFFRSSFVLLSFIWTLVKN